MNNFDEYAINLDSEIINQDIDDIDLYAERTVDESDIEEQFLPQNLDAMTSVIANRKGLGNLEVLMLEVNPYQQAQRAKMISLLENWFKDMGITKFTVADTDLPTNTNTVIDNFFNQ